MKSSKFKLILAKMLCMAFVLLSITPAFSSETDSIGKVIAIRGKALAISGTLESRPLVLKSPVFLSDTIKTKNGRLQMMFKDNTLVTLGRNSEMQITKYLWEPGDTKSAMETKVQEGSFRIMGGAITRIAPNNFKTDAPSGTIGIRGSMYAGKVRGKDLFVLFQGGKGIYVQNNAGIVDITRPGFGTQVKGANTPPEEPQKINTEELQEFENLLAESPEEDTSGTDGAAEPGEAVVESENEIPEPSGMEESTAQLESSSIEQLADVSSTISDATIGSTQSELNETAAPTGTEQEIQLLLLEQGFTETTLSTSTPDTGIWIYKGEMKSTLEAEDYTHTMKFIVNWKNRRIIGFEDASSGTSGSSDPGGMGFAFGTVDASGGISGMKVFGSDAGSDMGGEVMALSGSETFGHFYGATQGGLGLAMEGYDYNIQDQTKSEFWSDIVAALVTSKSSTTFTGTETWNGFFVGVAENMASPNTDRRIFYNDDYAGFSLTINKGAGTFSGTLSSDNDFNGSTYIISTLNIGGGSSNSAYITDKTLAAEITGAYISPTSTLKMYGNYMVSTDEPMLSDHTTWGYWEIAYEESDGDDYHLHVPGSMWIAGVKAELPTSFVGTYQGEARGVMFDNTSQMQTLTGGSTTLNIDFTGVSTPVWGNITFDGGINLPVTTNSSTDLSTVSGASIFNAEIAGATTSSVNGAFFGPIITGSSTAGPAAVGGNFNAQMPTGIQYHGIFAGDLQ